MNKAEDLLDDAPVRKFRESAQGKIVQYYSHKTGIWESLNLADVRLVPKIKEDIVTTMFVEAHPELDNAWDEPNLELTFDGQTGALKSVKILGNSENYGPI
jgi:hypothetical protein